MVLVNRLELVVSKVFSKVVNSDSVSCMKLRSGGTSWLGSYNHCGLKETQCFILNTQNINLYKTYSISHKKLLQTDQLQSLCSLGYGECVGAKSTTVCYSLLILYSRKTEAGIDNKNSCTYPHVWTAVLKTYNSSLHPTPPLFLKLFASFSNQKSHFL